MMILDPKKIPPYPEVTKSEFIRAHLIIWASLCGLSLLAKPVILPFLSLAFAALDDYTVFTGKQEQMRQIVNDSRAEIKDINHGVEITYHSTQRPVDGNKIRRTDVYHVCESGAMDCFPSHTVTTDDRTHPWRKAALCFVGGTLTETPIGIWSAVYVLGTEKPTGSIQTKVTDEESFSPEEKRLATRLRQVWFSSAQHKNKAVL